MVAGTEGPELNTFFFSFVHMSDKGDQQPRCHVVVSGKDQGGQYVRPVGNGESDGQTGDRSPRSSNEHIAFLRGRRRTVPV